MFKVLEGGGIKATACRTFGLNSVMYADRASDRIGRFGNGEPPVAGGLSERQRSSQFGRFRALISKLDTMIRRQLLTEEAVGTLLVLPSDERGDRPVLDSEP
jgi:hypothetical protein